MKERFLDQAQYSNEISLFLCGGGGAPENELRREIGKQISRMQSKYLYSVYYPEDLFVELILGHSKKDLLSLENLLADSVHCVVILVQSPGTCTELGAFANYEKLKDKLIVIIEPQYKRSQSFILRGPVRYLEDNTRSKVLYLKITSDNLNTLVRQISESAREIAKHSFPIKELSNPITSYKFYLALIYVFDPLGKERVFEIMNLLDNGKHDVAQTAAQTVINSLISEGKATCTTDKLSITKKGINSLIYDNQTKKTSNSTLSFLSTLRLEALNLTIRRRYVNYGRGDTSLASLPSQT
jgi:hypothetical protein